MASGWDALAGAAGYLQNRMMQQEELKYKSQLEEAAMKRQMFLDKYRSDLQSDRQKEINEQEARIREEQYNRERETTKNDVVATFNTPEGTYGRTKAGETVPFYQKSAEELQMEREKDRLELEGKRASIAQSYASASRDKNMGRAPAGYRWTTQGNLEMIPGGPAETRTTTGKKAGSEQKNDVMRDELVTDALNYAAAYTGIPKEKLAAMSPEQIEAAMKTSPPFFSGKLMGNIPGVSAVAGADLDAYAKSAAAKKARLNNPTGTVSNSDFIAAEAGMFGKDKSPEVNAQIVKDILGGKNTAPVGQGPGSSPSSPIDISSEAEAERLPPGTYVRLNGRVGRI